MTDAPTDRVAMNGRRMKLLAIAAGAAIAGLILLAWTQPWFGITLTDATELEITGEVAAAGLSALAVAALVLVGAISIAGMFFRYLLGSLQAFIGVAVILSASLALGNPISASANTISDATGIAGAEPVAALVDSVSVTAWPWVALVAGVLQIVAAAGILVTARSWPGSTRKYQAARLTTEGGSPVDDWDALSSGGDPTDDKP